MLSILNSTLFLLSCNFPQGSGKFINHCVSKISFSSIYIYFFAIHVTNIFHYQNNFETFWDCIEKDYLRNFVENITVRIQITMFVTVFKLYIHNTTSPQIWAVIAKISRQTKTAVDNSSRRDFKIVQGGKINRGNAQMPGTSGWSRLIWRILLARQWLDSLKQFQGFEKQVDLRILCSLEAWAISSWSMSPPGGKIEHLFLQASCSEFNSY